MYGGHPHVGRPIFPSRSVASLERRIVGREDSTTNPAVSKQMSFPGSAASSAHSTEILVFIGDCPRTR